METAIERRTHGVYRVPLEGLIELKHAGFDEAFEADGVNLGAGGIALRATYLPDVGDRLSCRFPCPVSGDLFEAHGEVVWAHDSGPHVGEFALRFTQLPGEAAEAIRHILAIFRESSPTEQSIDFDPRARLYVDGVATPIVARVADRGSGTTVLEQELPFLRIGTGVEMGCSGMFDRGEHRGRLTRVSVSLEGDMPKLLLTVEDATLPGFDESAMDERAMSSEAFEPDFSDVTLNETTTTLDESLGMVDDGLATAPELPVLERALDLASDQLRSSWVEVERPQAAEAECVPRRDDPREDAREGVIVFQTHREDPRGPESGLAPIERDAGQAMLAVAAPSTHHLEVPDGASEADALRQRPCALLAMLRRGTNEVVRRAEPLIAQVHAAQVHAALRAAFLLVANRIRAGAPARVEALRRALGQSSSAGEASATGAERWTRAMAALYRRLRTFSVLLVEKTAPRVAKLLVRPKRRRTTAAPPKIQRANPARRRAQGKVEAPMAPRRNRRRALALFVAATTGVGLSVYALAPSGDAVGDAGGGSADDRMIETETGTDLGASALDPEAGPDSEAETRALGQTSAAPKPGSATTRVAATPVGGRMPAPTFPTLEAAARPAAPPGVTPPDSPYAIDVRQTGDTGAATAASGIDPAQEAASSSPGTGPLAFGAESIDGARTFTLRMSRPVTEIRGTETSDGIHVVIPGSLSLDRAGPIAANHAAVEKSMILNRGDHAILTLRFAEGKHPAYRVAARGASIEVQIE